jgi:hypothetical protein
MVNELLPFDITEILHTERQKERRPNDFLLHASSHLEGSLRHAQLDVAGAPKLEESLTRDMPLWIGTLLHEEIHRMLRKVGVPYMAEVNMNPWLPRGWGGTADAFIWNPQLKAFVLTDFKSSKGAGMKWIERDGAKVEHVKQTSAYWHAARKMGLPLAKKVGVYYLPKDGDAEPLLVDFDPLPVKELAKTMRDRHGSVSDYVSSLPKPNPRPLYTEEYVTDALAPVQERQQRIYYDKTTDTWDVKLVPHWSTAYCPFPDELCDCRTQGTTKIGTYDFDGTYWPRKGYEQIEPTVTPS